MYLYSNYRGLGGLTCLYAGLLPAYFQVKVRAWYRIGVWDLGSGASRVGLGFRMEGSWRSAGQASSPKFLLNRKP